MQDSGFLAVFKVTARDQGHYKGPSGAFITYCTFLVLFKTFFHSIGKKNNQSSVSDVDREIPTLGLTDNAGNEVNVSGIIRLPSDWDFSVCIVSGIIRLPSGWNFSVCIGDQ